MLTGEDEKRNPSLPSKGYSTQSQSSRGTWVTINDLIADICDGPRQVEVSSEGVPLIRMGDLNPGDIHLNQDTFVCKEKLSERFILKTGDILLSKTGDEPRASSIPSELVGSSFSPDVYRLRVIPGKISSSWLSLYLNTKYATTYLFKKSYGRTVRRLHLADLRAMPIPVPPLQLLQELEVLVEQAHKASESAHLLLAAARRGLYSEIFSRAGISPAEDLSSYSLVHLQEVLRKAGFFHPLTTLAEFVVSSRKEFSPDQIVCYVQVSDLDPSSLTFRRTRSSRLAGLSNRIRLPLRENQILLLVSGSNLGSKEQAIAVVEQQLEGCLATNAFLALEFQDSPLYYGLALKHPLVLAQLSRMAVGNVVQTLRKRDLVNLLVPVLSSVWRQDFDERARLGWERRSHAHRLHGEAMQRAEAFVEEALKERS